jgi:hypothetical protein
LQFAATVHTSKPVPPPVTTSLPNANKKWPTESNFEIRLLPASAMYRLPYASVDTPVGRSSSPPWPPPPPITLRTFPEESNFWTRLFKKSAT